MREDRSRIYFKQTRHQPLQASFVEARQILDPSTDHKIMLPPISARKFSGHGNTVINRSFFLVMILSLIGLLAGVESFHSVSLPESTRQQSRNIQPGDSMLDQHYQMRIRAPTQQQNRIRHQVFLKANEDDTDVIGGGVLESIGLVSQPVVWISLYSLATTGHGLPAGPGGSIGAVEGLAYLVVLVLAILPTNPETNEGSPSLAKALSRSSIALGLLVLAGVAAGKGCVPNAKPILDYSAYLPVCGPE